jgi:NADPH-dependent 2,4-dienoyl-CoA reductase/sulfur reductase-like enzyme
MEEVVLIDIGLDERFVTSKSPEPAPLRLPVENSTVPFWHKETHPIHDTGSDTPLPDASDVVIIGAGYAGVATAYNLVKGNPTGQELSVTILEAKSVCSGATGRNGIIPSVYIIKVHFHLH